MNIKPFGNSAILIEFKQVIDESVNDLVLKLYNKIKARKIEGVLSLVPAYSSLTIVYNAEVNNYTALVKKIEEIFYENETIDTKQKQSNRNIEIPICYDDEFGIDLLELSNTLNFSVEQIVELHLSQSYRVFMIGFLPGFPYLGKLNDRIFTNRRKIPRKKVAAGSVGIAALQTGIYPIEAPGGWNIIGRTPSLIFNAQKKSPFLLNVGDNVTFKRISKNDFKKYSSSS